MNAKHAARLFELDAMTLGANLEGVSHEESLRSPAGGDGAAGNSSNWVLGHILATRNQVLGLIGLETVGDAERLARYDRGSDPIGPDDAVPLEELRAGYATSQEQLLAFLAEVDEERLATPLPEGMPDIVGQNLGEALAFFAWHEGYHAGQLGVLRRTVGRAGAIA